MLRRITLLAVGFVLAANAAFAETATGNPKLQSIESLCFAPDGRLIIGDGKGAQVVAIHTGDTKPVAWSKLGDADLKEQIAAKLGSKNVEFIRLIVNPASQRGYLAVRKGDQDAILTIDGDGKVGELDLTNVKYTRYPLSADGKAAPVKITDITYADSRVLFVVNADKQTKIFTVDTRGEEAAPQWVAAETYHVGHGKWETANPIRTVIPYVENGKTFLVGAFTCTPIVKYSLDDLKAGGGRVQGNSVIELGTGNTPQDMFVYSKGDKNYILMNQKRNNGKSAPGYPTAYWTAKVEQGILGETEKINEKAPWRKEVGKGGAPTSDRAQMVPDFANVVTMDRLGDDRALVIRTDDKGGYRLAVLPLP